jgi:hypothetical protein
VRYRSTHVHRARRFPVAAAIAATVLAAVVGYQVTRSQPGSPARRPPGEAASDRTASGRQPSTTSRTYSPPRVSPPNDAVQSQVDEELARAETQSSLDPAVGKDLPHGSDSTEYPAVPNADRQDPSAYATAFVAEMLGRVYGRQSRTQLLAWAQSESAPNTLPGVPVGLASESLVLSLVAPDSSDGPLPSVGQWTALATKDTSQTVMGVQTQVDPDWLALISTGWEPVDPAMTMLSVTGTLATHAGGGVGAQPFAFVLTLGSSSTRPGYGAVAVDDWTVG